MAELTVDMIYGSALYQAAVELKKEQTILEESQGLVAVFRENPELAGLLRNPTISAADKKVLIQKVFEGRISPELLNFLYVLVDKRRVRHFDRAVRVYKQLMDKAQGISYGKIQSVRPLSGERIREFEEQAGNLLKTRVALENEVDPSLLGGVKIFVNGKVFDASVRTRLLELGNTIK